MTQWGLLEESWAPTKRTTVALLESLGGVTKHGHLLGYIENIIFLNLILNVVLINIIKTL